MLTIAEMEIAARMNGMEYGKYSNLLENGLATLPPMEEIRAQMVKPKRRSTVDAALQPVVCYDFDGEFVRVYPSVAVAAELLGKSRSMIRYALSGRARSAHGFQWRYEGDAPPGKYVKEVQTIKITSKRTPVDKVCKVCGKTFKGVGSAKYCSDACRQKGRQTQKTEYMREYRQKVKKVKKEAKSA